MTPSSQLPPGFETLEPFVERWAVRGSDARMRRRLDSTPQDREAFYAAGRGLLDQALAHLDAQPLGALSAADQCLLDLLLALAHVALAIEQQRDLEPQHARMQSHFRIERSVEEFGTPAPSGTR